ncbi:MAG TPA: serine hydrolase domain-containing protein [Candidatus Binataceae bacterium]
MDTQRIDRLLIEACNEYSLAGLAAAIISDRRLVYTKGFGIADAARNLPITASTIFRIGSISKTFTAIGLMQLYEQGKFKLDDPVNRYLKAYRIEPPTSAPPVTFRHLLTHTSGIGELRKLTDLLRPTLGLGCKPGKAPALNEYYRPALRTGTAAGVKWAYANHGFATLGQLVEDISGQPFASYMTENVFHALGMEHTSHLRDERVREALAQGYRMTRRGLKPIRYAEIIVAPAGSVFSSIDDMAKYVLALLSAGANEHGRVLRAETLAMMMTPQYEIDPRMAAQGLGFMLGKDEGLKLVGHDGGLPGFSSAMWLAPERSVGVLLFANSSTLALHGMASELIREATNAAEAAPPPPILERPALWNELLGTYRPMRCFNSNLRLWFLGGALRVFIMKGHLMIGGRHPFGPVRRGLRLLAADPADSLYFKARLSGTEATVLFRRDAAGKIVSMSVAASAGAFFTVYKGKPPRGA